MSENRILPAEQDGVTSERERLRRWLEDEAAKRTNDAKARRQDAASTRGMSAQELRDAKTGAEKMFGRKLDLVSTKVEDNERNCDMQDRIAAKLEKEAHLLSKWAGLLRNSESAESRLAALSAIVEPLRDLYEKATKGPLTLCFHLESKANDDSCLCGYRGSIWSGDGEQIVCEMGVSPDTTGDKMIAEPDRDTSRANAHLFQRLFNAFPKIAALVPPVEKGEK